MAITVPDESLYDHYCHCHITEYREVDRLALIDSPLLDPSEGPHDDNTTIDHVSLEGIH